MGSKYAVVTGSLVTLVPSFIAPKEGAGCVSDLEFTIIWHFRWRKPCQLSGWMKSSPYYNAMTRIRTCYYIQSYVMPFGEKSGHHIIWFKTFFCDNYHASAAIISYLDKYTCENAICYLHKLYDLEKDIQT